MTDKLTVPSPTGTAAPHGPWSAPAPRPGSAPDPAPPAGRLRRAAVPLGVLAGVVSAFAYVASVDPNTPGHYPVCPLLAYTGIFCPGCGGLRSAHAFAHGDVGAALGLNALAVACYVLFAVVWTVWLSRTLRGRAFEIRLRPVYWWAVGAAVLFFGVARNLPFGSALAP
ncbi:DUF2752 domain-containing protein [Streptomyces sp. H39-S7]|uniref:DUF2752 domain-containing protein n=1 Tax=Streptomyces sp. H39-S7 TaxID=3004357 RepID=UPI003FA73D16